MNSYAPNAALSTPRDTNSKIKVDIPNAPKKPAQKKLVMDMSQELICPCGGGQSCIVDRRWVGDWVHEDDVFASAGLPIRKNCFVNFTREQKTILAKNI